MCVLLDRLDFSNLDQWLLSDLAFFFLNAEESVGFQWTNHELQNAFTDVSLSFLHIQ